MGHCEPASGVAGIMKCVLALEHRLRPPLQELEKINPNRKSIARKAARALCVDTEQSISRNRPLDFVDSEQARVPNSLRWVLS